MGRTAHLLVPPVASRDDGGSGTQRKSRGVARQRRQRTSTTGLPVLDRLLERLAQYARFDLALEVEPGAAEAEVAEAGSALGRALAEPLRATGRAATASRR